MNRKVIILAVVLGLLTVVGLAYYIDTLKNNKVSAESYSTVVVAASTIPANVKITPEMVTTKSISTEAVHPEAYTTIDSVVGGISNSEIVSGEQLISSRVVVEGGDTSLAYRVPENMRAMSIPTSEVTGVAGNINVGDKIDIIVTYDTDEVNPQKTTFTQLQNIEVVAIGNVIQGSLDEAAELPNTITVLVKPAQVEVLVYALESGSVRYTLRNPADTKNVDLSNYNGKNFGSYKTR